MEITQTEATKGFALQESDKTQLQNIPFTLLHSNDDRSIYPKKLECRCITDELRIRIDFGLKLQINKKDYIALSTLLEKSQPGILDAQK